MSSTTKGFLLVLLSAAILSVTAVLIRVLTLEYGMPALVLAFWRDFFVSGSLAIVLLLFNRSLLKVSSKNFAYLVLYGFALAVFNIFFTTSVVMNGAAVGTILIYSSGAFTVVLGYLLLRERLCMMKFVAVALSLAGCVFVANAHNPSAWQVNTTGIMFGLGSGFLYACYSILGKSAANRGLNPWTTILYTFGLAACFLLLFNLLPFKIFPGTAKHSSELLMLANRWLGWGYLFILAAGPTLVGFGLLNMSLIYLPSSVSNLVLAVEPVFTAIIAYFWLGEGVSLIQVFGAALILLSILVLSREETARAREPVLTSD